MQLRATPGVDFLRREPAVHIDEMRAVLTQDPHGDVPRLVRRNGDREDGAAIVLRHAGPLTIIGGSYGDGDQRVPQIHLAGVGEQTVSIIGAKFGAFDANLVHPVKANRGVGDVVTRLGCTYQTSSTSPSRTTTLNTAPVLRA